MNTPYGEAGGGGGCRWDRMTLTTTERKGLGLRGSTPGTEQSFQLALTEALSDLFRDERRAGPRSPEKHVYILTTEYLHHCLFCSLLRRQQAVTYLLLDPKAKVFITEMQCVVF